MTWPGSVGIPLWFQRVLLGLGRELESIQHLWKSQGLNCNYASCEIFCSLPDIATLLSIQGIHDVTSIVVHLAYWCEGSASCCSHFWCLCKSYGPICNFIELQGYFAICWISLLCYLLGGIRDAMSVVKHRCKSSVMVLWLFLLSTQKVRDLCAIS